MRRAEASVAILITTMSVVLHYIAAASAGPLWRDEANSVAVATLPRLSDVWNNLQFDSFPAGWMFFVRILASGAGAMNDSAFRIAGFVIGLLLLGALWYDARVFKTSFPLISLALLGLNPSVIRWGDSLRGYGAGMVLAAVTAALIWRFVENNTVKRFAAAALAATMSVHALYYNAPVVLAFCIAGASVAILKHDWKKAFGVVAIGGVAGASLIIYLPTIAVASRWNSVVTIPHYTSWWFLVKLDETLSPLGSWAKVAWAFALLLAAAVVVDAWLSRANRREESDSSKMIFLAVALLGNMILQFIFLKTLSYLTQPWYYLMLLTTAAICADAIAGSSRAQNWRRVVRIGFALTIAAISLFPASRYLGRRMTNVDVAANLVAKRARSNDLIVVAPWYFGVTFNRYYRGSTPWMTAPAIGLHEFHRYDLIVPKMEESDQTVPAKEVIDVIRKSLQSGNSLYLVSSYRLWRNPASSPPQPAVFPRDGWRYPAYETHWLALVGEALNQHADRHSPELLIPGRETSNYERVLVTVFTGWH